MSKCFSTQSLELLELLICWETRFEWFMTKKSGVYIAWSVTFSSLWIGDCDDTCWTARCQVAITKKLVNMLSLGCFTSMEGVNRFQQTDPGAWSTSLALKDDFEFKSRWSWQLETGDKEGSQLSD